MGITQGTIIHTLTITDRIRTMATLMGLRFTGTADIDTTTAIIAIGNMLMQDADRLARA
jgi:hypothetical protein